MNNVKLLFPSSARWLLLSLLCWVEYHRSFFLKWVVKSVVIVLQATQCEHAFCSVCINDWLNRQSTCPIDRGMLLRTQLKPVPRILRNLLSRLKITCNNAEFGCTAVVKLDQLSTHIQVESFNWPVSCITGAVCVWWGKSSKFQCSPNSFYYYQSEEK
jgi:RING-H2 zinc finger domain